MTTQHKVFADYEVLTADDVNDYLMNQVVVKVTTSTDLASLPTEVRTAYVNDTGQVMARDNTDAWVPLGGVAAVGSTAPSNPQTGQLWVDTTEVLPVATRITVSNNFVTINATAWGTTYGSTGSITLSKAAVCSVSLSSWLQCISGTADLRGRVKWTGALAGNSYDHLGGWHGTVYQSPASANTNYSSHGLHFHLALPAGTTTFAFEAYKGSAATSPQISYVGIEVMPVHWADVYASGVS